MPKNLKCHRLRELDFQLFPMLALLFMGLLIQDSTVIGDDNEQYRGKYLGKLNVYHHQVSGDVYAVDPYTLLLTSFSYDGNGYDTFFWAGSSNRPGPQGFIVPDEYGKTNKLEQYHDKDFTLTLPDNRKITDIKWFAIYDLTDQNTFGDIYIPEEFDSPAPHSISHFSQTSHNVSSGAIVILDSKTISIPELNYDGLGEDTYFWVGVGQRPSTIGSKVPDENGYLEPLHAYKDDDVIIQLPGDMTVFNIQWLSIYDIKTRTSFGYVSIPDTLNVPPSLVKVIKYPNVMPNCVQLHKKLQVGWEVSGPVITIMLAGQIMDNEYMAFGLSGSDTRSQMEGADAAIAYMDSTRPYIVDYNITAKTPCAKVLGRNRGVCKDVDVEGMDSNLIQPSSRKDGITIIPYARSLIPIDIGDKEYPTDKPVYVIWAIGRLDENNEPSFHDFYPKHDVLLDLRRSQTENSCIDFTDNNEKLRKPWEKEEIFDRSIRTFRATIGPSGGRRGYQALTGQTSMGLAWYINGQLAPELYLRRGLTYNFKVYGGNNPHSANLYHPLIITDEPHGGFDRMDDNAQARVRVLAGVEFTRRGRPRPTAVGPLCSSQHHMRDRRLDDSFPTFKKFNRTLVHTCEPGDPGVLEVTPNSTWPDIVYYNSFTHANMGWKIHIVDAYSKSDSTSKSLSLSAVTLFLLLLIL
ncbi:hypothetical protein QAD02_022962 [Eretmocerus hayati]|uniref:Uncharacterized protein n=1 Tax=Eretmocerus hayati TaxID=131215 RepID=A0ACC2PVL7_9HYME|nr:hypothetical protein QAD02_022962 [Eretmocerus hayati]